MSEERLTERSKKGIAMVKGCGENCEYGFSYCRKDEWENCKTISDLIDKLTEYEDLEEQGLLLRLPCRMGDVVWVVAESYILGEVGDKSESWYSIHTEKFNPYMLKDIGKIVFLTQAEAEEKLRELEGK